MGSNFEEQTMINIRNLAARVTNLEAQENPSIVALYSTATTQSLPSGTDVIMNYDIKAYDPRNCVTTGANWAFTAPVAGFYYVTASARANGTFVDNTGIALRFFINGAVVKVCDYNEVEGAMTDPYAYQMKGSSILHLDVGDTLDARLSQSSGYTNATVAASIYSYIEIMKMVS